MIYMLPVDPRRSAPGATDPEKIAREMLGDWCCCLSFDISWIAINMRRRAPRALIPNLKRSSSVSVAKTEISISLLIKCAVREIERELGMRK